MDRLPKDVAAKAQQWLDWDVDKKTRGEIQALVDKGDADSLGKALLERIAFGTAGLRAEMKAGFAYMNLLTVTQATQGFCVHLENSFGSAALKERGVVIGYDGRFNSKAFAHRAAAIFASRGAQVHLFGQVVPTPFVSYGVKKLGCVAGVMVTASHNPAADNGYKVYWSDAAQITAPHDRLISAAIEANAAPWPLHVGAALDAADAAGRLSDPSALVSASYMHDILSWSFQSSSLPPPALPRIVFTPMHGVGAKWVEQAFRAFGLPPYFPVMRQLFPDPTFPTVAFPNPEEGAGALALSYAEADRVGAPIVLACDPDADRLAVAEKTPGGEWKMLSGNQVGFLLADWLTEQLLLAKKGAIKEEQLLLATTVVSSGMYRIMAQKRGFAYVETLTGFKWIGEAVLRLQKERPDIVPVVAYEQAIGYMVGDICPDKDGVRTAAVVAQLVSYTYAIQHSSLFARLEAIYARYGYLAGKDHYFFCYDPKVMFAIFGRMGSSSAKPESYPAALGPYQIARIRDLAKPGYDNGAKDNKPTLPVGSSPMMTFFFANGGTITLRGSGTEPKLKYYAELPGARGEADKTLAHMIQLMVEHWLQPERNGLVPPSD